MPVLCFHQLCYFWAFLESPKAGKVGILSLPAGCPPSNAKKEKKFLIFPSHFGLLILKANGPSSPPPPHTALNAFLVGIHATSRNSCYLTAARLCWGRFSSSRGSGSKGGGWRHAAIDKQECWGGRGGGVHLPFRYQWPSISGCSKQCWNWVKPPPTGGWNIFLIYFFPRQKCASVDVYAFARVLILYSLGAFGLPYSKEIFRICQLRSWPPHYASSSTTTDFSSFIVPLNVVFLLWKNNLQWN